MSERPVRLSVKKRKFVVDTMRKEILKERTRAARGTKKMINRLASEYRKSIFNAVKEARTTEKELIDHIVAIRDKFKSGLKDIDERDTVKFQPLREETNSESKSDSKSESKPGQVAQNSSGNPSRKIPAQHSKSAKSDDTVKKSQSKKRARAASIATDEATKSSTQLKKKSKSHKKSKGSAPAKKVAGQRKTDTLSEDSVDSDDAQEDAMDA